MLPQTTLQPNKLNDKLKEHFERLPKNVQEAILSVQYRQALKNIVTQHRLHIDQAADLDTETTLVMLGLESIEDYGKNLVAEAHIDPETAILIERDINNKIFLPIATTLHEIVLREQGGEEYEEELKYQEHDLADVELVSPTLNLPHRGDVVPDKERLEDSMTSTEPAVNFAQQKLTDISGIKKTETVVEESKPEQKKSDEPLPPKKPYPGGFDPYHETV